MNIFLAFAAVTAVVLLRKKFVDDWHFFMTNRPEWVKDKWENWIKPLIVAAVLAFAIRTFIIGPYKIPTGSMRPVLMEGDRIFVDKLTYRFKEPRRGDVIVFKYPLDRKKDFVKRLVGLGGEVLEIKDGQVYVNNERLTGSDFPKRFYYNRDDWSYGKRGQQFRVPENFIFALGDNSAQSSDSRKWGFVPHKDVIGRAVLIWWPPQRFRLLKNSDSE